MIYQYENMDAGGWAICLNITTPIKTDVNQGQTTRFSSGN